MIRKVKNNAKFLARIARVLAFVSFALLFSGFSVYSQEPLYGFVKLNIDRGNMEGAQIIITENGKAWKNVSPSKARYEYDLDYGNEYLFTFTKPGYITKKIIFNTKVPEDRIVEGFVPFQFKVTLFKQYDGINTVVFNQPVGIIGFNLEVDDFDYDTDYTKSIQAALREVEEQIEEKRKEEDKAEAEAKKAAAEEAKAEEARKKKAEEEAKKKAKVEAEAQEAVRKKAEEEAARKKTAGEARAKAASEKAAAKNVKAADAAKAKEAAAAKRAADAQAKRVAAEAARNAAAAEKAAVAAEQDKRNAEAKAKKAALDNSTTSIKGGASVRHAARLKAAADAKKRAAARAKLVTEQRTRLVDKSLPNERKVEFAERSNRKITKVIIRRAGLITTYRKVEHAWGGIYYFREMENITKIVFDLETTL